MEAVGLAYVEELARRPEVDAVILFGSQAHGDARPDSDIDLIVLVADGYRRAIDERDGQAFELLFLGPDVARGYFEQHPALRRSSGRAPGSCSIATERRRACAQRSKRCWPLANRVSTRGP